MPSTFRIASFNVENLFSRAKVFNFHDHNKGDEILQKTDELRKLLEKQNYDPNDRKLILDLYNELKTYIEIREDRRKLFKKKNNAIIGIEATGVDDWDGTIEFKQSRFSEVARENTAKVIKDVRSHIACIVEAESRPMLRSFDAHLLGSRYKYDMLIDANDPRGIDVGLYSKYPLGRILTHIFDVEGGKTVFSRDCLEVEVFLPNGKPLYVLCNHFKSRGYDYDNTADQKRERQAKRVAQILGRYDLLNDWVIIAGDLNDNPSSAPLQPLLTVQNIYDVLELQFPTDPMKRWTYHYDKFEQIDFILVSEPLKNQFRKAGVERRGIYDLKNLTSSSNGLVDVEQEYNTVTRFTDAASDHGAVWAEFSL